MIITEANKNHGLYWSAGEIKLCYNLFRGGLNANQVALQLKRSASACECMYRSLRRMYLLEGPNVESTDTLLTLRKKGIT